MPTSTGSAPPARLWSKEATPPSESSPLVPGEGPGWDRFASPLPWIPARYSWFKARRSGLICTICLLYMAVLSKSLGDAALYASLPSVRTATGFAGVLTNLPAAGTAAYGVGKAIGIITASHMGGRITMMVGLVGGVMLLLFADGRYSVMLTTWIIFRFGTSQTWGGFTMIVANWVDGADVGKVMGMLAIAWELGTGGAEAIFGLMLGTHGVDHWREPFYVAGLFNVTALVGIFFFLHSSATSAGYRPPLLKHESEGQHHPLEHSSVQVALEYFCASGRFWLILVSNCCILAAMYTLFFMNVYAVKALGATDQQGAFLLTYVSIGTIVAIVIATAIYDGLSKLQRAIMLSVSNFCFFSLTVISFSLNVSGQMTIQLLAALGSLTAFCGGLGAYLPISIFQVTGPSSSPSLPPAPPCSRPPSHLPPPFAACRLGLTSSSDWPDPIWWPATRIYDVQPARHLRDRPFDLCVVPSGKLRRGRAVHILLGTIHRQCASGCTAALRRRRPICTPRPTACHPSQARMFTYRPHACCQVMIATTALVAFGWADYYHERKALRGRVDSEPTLPVKQ